MNLTTATQNRIACEKALALYDAAVDRERQELTGALARAREQEAQAAAGLDPERIARGLAVVEVSGKRERLIVGDVPSVVESAKRAVAEGGGALFREMFGAKDYDRWTCQRSDHSYGYAPSHGTIVFQIRLTRDARQRGVLTEAEVEDALYVLANVETVLGSREVKP